MTPEALIAEAEETAVWLEEDGYPGPAQRVRALAAALRETREALNELRRCSCRPWRSVCWKFFYLSRKD
jgi:hypothetical protein